MKWKKRVFAPRWIVCRWMADVIKLNRELCNGFLLFYIDEPLPCSTRKTLLEHRKAIIGNKHPLGDGIRRIEDISKKHFASRSQHLKFVIFGVATVERRHHHHHRHHDRHRRIYFSIIHSRGGCHGAAAETDATKHLPKQICHLFNAWLDNENPSLCDSQHI